MTAQLPDSWKAFYGNDFAGLSPLQLRTGAATQALSGPGAVFTTPESMDYWRRLASESIDPFNPPQDVDYQYLQGILGRPQPSDSTVQSFLDALNF